MKPSQRIVEIHNSKNLNGVGEMKLQHIATISDILYYLDEEYEKNKPCEHIETEPWNDYSVCKKCKRLVG